jgi:hypothetical protein
MSRMTRLPALGLLLLSSGFPVLAGTVTYSLTGSDPNFTEVQSSGYQSGYSGAGVTMSRTGGTGNGVDFLESVFRMNGDFTVKVDTDATEIAGSEAGLGISLYDPTNTGPMDIYYAGYPSVYSNLQGVSGTNTYGGGPTDTFEITRTGNIVTTLFNDGNGFQQLNQAVEWAGPAEVDLLFLTENGSSVASSTTFSNLVITADSFGNSAAPEPASVFLLLPALGVLAFRARKTYAGMGSGQI